MHLASIFATSNTPMAKYVGGKSAKAGGPIFDRRIILANLPETISPVESPETDGNSNKGKSIKHALLEERDVEEECSGRGCAHSLALARQLCGQLGNRLVQISHKCVVGNLSDGCLGVRIDTDDDLTIFHSSDVLN